jgi:hypothetical protein
MSQAAGARRDRHPDSCRVLKSSGNELLDRQTCKLVGTHPSFTMQPREGGELRPVDHADRHTWRLEDQAALFVIPTMISR